MTLILVIDILQGFIETMGALGFPPPPLNFLVLHSNFFRTGGYATTMMEQK